VGASVDPVVVRPITLGDIAGFIAAADTIFRERVYFAHPEPMPIDQSAKFVASNILLGNPQLVADDGGGVVGWCDIVRKTVAIERHTGVLGIGVLARYRSTGLGERLLRQSIEAARAAEFERIELQVFAANTRAFALYSKAGFVTEGRRIRAKKLDDAYDDILMMAMVL
jgi:ribosomal protein S18 acetylase RimI-like enzyme